MAPPTGILELQHSGGCCRPRPVVTLLKAPWFVPSARKSPCRSPPLLPVFGAPAMALPVPRPPAPGPWNHQTHP